MERDVRIMEYYQLIQERDNYSFSSLMLSHDFNKINTIIEWLHKQILTKAFAIPPAPKIQFPEVIVQDNLTDDLSAGDQHYYNLFKLKNLIGDQVKEFEIPDPFSTVVRRIYDHIWEIQTSRHGGSLTIYSSLEDYLSSLLGKSVGADHLINTYDQWHTIFNTAFQIRAFYPSWISSIPDELIIARLEELVESFFQETIPDRLLRMSYRNPATYQQVLEEAQNASDWNYIDKTTWGSDLIDLDESIKLKGQLLLRCGIRNWLRWWDNLKWPIVQDSVLHGKDNFIFLDELITVILDNTIQLATKREYLLLMVLKHYYYFCTTISTKLDNIINSNGSIANTRYRDGLISQAKEQNSKWLEELPTRCKELYQKIFNNTPVSQSSYFLGAWQWISSYSRLNLVDKNLNIELTVLDAFQDAFNSVQVSDATNKIEHINALDHRFVNWENLKSLISLFDQDKGNPEFRDALIDKYRVFVRQEKFFWNAHGTFTEEAINQAFHFAYLIAALENPSERWKEFYLEFKYWHEGWLVFNNRETNRNKELYLLLVGVSLAYLYFQRQNTTEGNQMLDIVSAIIYQQCRTSHSGSQEYNLAVRFIAHINAQFRPDYIDTFVELINTKIDNINIFLEALYEISLKLKKDQRTWSNNSFAIINNRIEHYFPFIELKYGRAGLKNKLDYYKAIKDQVISLTPQN